MPRIFDFAGRDVERRQTVAGLRALKGTGQRVTQVTAETAEEAAAADEAGIEMVVCRGANVRQVRAGSQRLFVTAALGFTQAVTVDDMQRAAFGAIEAGADAVITARGPEMVRALSAESIPVGGTSRFRSSQIDLGRFGAGGRQDRRRSSGAVGPVSPPRGCRRIRRGVRADPRRCAVRDQPSHPARHHLAWVGRRTSKRPRYARAWADLASLYRAVRDERVRALSGFRAAVASAGYPAAREIAVIPDHELKEFRARLGAENEDGE
jgi:3-methyl-2-oxobutanoate hydroxymethyltransferase